MPEFLYLADLLRTGRAARHAVASRQTARMDFAAFERDTAAWYSAFLDHPGTRFGLFFADSYVFATALFGAWHAQKTVYLLADVAAANVTSLASLVHGFAGDIAGAECVKPMVGAAPPQWQPLDPQARHLVVYTSGSSGAPVGIVKRLSQLFDEVAALAQCFDARLGDAEVCTTVSHQHIYGLLFSVLWPLACGRPFTAQRLAFAEDIVAECSKDGGHALIASPAHLKRLPEQLGWDAVRSKLRAVFSSGGPLPDEALPSCHELLGQTPIEVYGSSETGGVAWRQRQPGGALTWQPLPGVAIQINDEALEVRSKHTDAEGWQTMSDRVRSTGLGFELLGRLDRIVKVEEKRVSLQAVEQALLATRLLVDVRVLVQTVRRAQLIVVGVPSDEGWQLLESEGKAAYNVHFRSALKAVVEPSALPRRWRYVSGLPINAQGKTTESALLDLFDPRRPEMRVMTRSANAVSLQIQIAPESPYFDGHFSDAPVLPGVAQLDWVALFAREFFVLPPAFQRLEVVKFQQIIRPGMVIDMALAVDTERGRLSFALTSVTGSHANGRFIFGSAA